MDDRRRSLCGGSQGRDGGNQRTKLELSPSNNSTLSIKAIPDEILATEIFPRLADARTAIRCSAVSKLWRSHISAADFIPNFVRRHHGAPTSFTMLVGFRFTTSNTFKHTSNPTYLTVDGTKYSNKITTELRPDFRSDLVGSRLDSASGEFLLFSKTLWYGGRKLDVLNVITKQTLSLPELPCEEKSATVALVTHPGSHLCFSVLCISYFSPSYRYTIFSSETGRWSDLAPAPKLTKSNDVVAHRGLLFWVESGYWESRLVIFDALAESWRFVAGPGYSRGYRDSYYGPAVEFEPPQLPKVANFLYDKHRVRIGIVQGRVRMARLFRVALPGFVLKIWELEEGDLSEWRLVAEVCLENDPVVHGKWLYVMALDPVDPDTVFLGCECHVYRYSLSRGSYERVLGLSCEAGRRRFNLNKVLPTFSYVFTLSHPIWPTALPSSSSNPS